MRLAIFPQLILDSIFGFYCIVSRIGLVLGPYKVHVRDTLKVADRDSLSNQVQELTKQLNAARDNLDIRSPAANNLMHVLQAFRSYRGMLGGYKPISCQIRLTAPPDSGPIPCISIFNSGHKLHDVRTDACKR